jgi:DNA-binding IclR family transcriptional regulator
MNSTRPSQRDPQFVSTLASGVHLLMCFTPGEPSLGNKDLVERTGLSKPTVSRLTRTLVTLGYLRINRQTGKYLLGAATLSIGYPLIAGLKVRQIARPLMRELAESVQGVVSLGMRDRTQMIYLDAVLSEHSQISTRELGAAVPIMGTAIGRAWLAVAGPVERTEVLNQIFIKDPAQYHANAALIAGSMLAFEQQGYATNRGVVTGVYGFAVALEPSPGHQRIIFNCSVSHHLGEFHRIEKSVAPALVHLVRTVEQAMGLR